MKIQYHLFDLSLIQKDHFSKIEKLYKLWHFTFKEIFDANGGVLDPDAFWRGRVLAGLFHEDTPIGVHIYNPYFIMDSLVQTSSYFKTLPPGSLELIKQRGVSSLMSMEYLCVHPDYRGAHDGVRVSELVIGLGFQVLLQSPYEMAIGFARADRKVDAVSTKTGAYQAGQTSFLNKDIRVMLCHRNEVKISENFRAQRWIDDLWKNRLISIAPSFQQRKAA